MIGLKIRKALGEALWRGVKKISPKKYECKHVYSTKRFKKAMMDPAFPWQKYEGQINPYFLKWGFEIPMLESAYYSEVSGIKADHYVPMTLYFNYIYPYLNRDAWRWAYTDKNMFSRILDIRSAQQEIDVRMPETLVCCTNGRLFVGELKPAGEDEVLDLLEAYGGDVIIKPTVGSGHGSGVSKLHLAKQTREELKAVLRSYGLNYTVQKVIEQHPDLASFNESSVNTIRITTYQDFRGNVKILYAAQRFGGEGKVYDNADDPNGSGGFVRINLADGRVERSVHRYRNMHTMPLKESAAEMIPCFDKVKAAVVYMHRRLPQFALVAWDVTVTPDGHPVIIEYNFKPGLGTSQVCNGPMFCEEDLNEIMNRIQNAHYTYVYNMRITWPDHEGYVCKYANA